MMLTLGRLNCNLEEAKKEKDALVRSEVLESDSNDQVRELQRQMDEFNYNFSKQLEEKDKSIKELMLTIKGLYCSIEEAVKRDKNALAKAGVMYAVKMAIEKQMSSLQIRSFRVYRMTSQWKVRQRWFRGIS